MRLNKITILLILLLIFGCSYFQPKKGLRWKYENRVKDWQERIKKEGWTKTNIDKIINYCVKISRYRPEENDYWYTPKEMIDNGFWGDCEDIASLMFGTLKRLHYPYPVRIRVVNTFTGGHAVLRVHLPDKTWAQYETVPSLYKYPLDRLFWKPIYEFDENKIYWLVGNTEF
jgi:transglutaminase-like putative cysteine protease